MCTHVQWAVDSDANVDKHYLLTSTAGVAGRSGPDLSCIPLWRRVVRVPSRASTDPLGEAWATSSESAGEPIGLAALEAEPSAADHLPFR